MIMAIRCVLQRVQVYACQQLRIRHRLSTPDDPSEHPAGAAVVPYKLHFNNAEALLREDRIPEQWAPWLFSYTNMGAV